MKVFVKKLTFKTIIGLLPHERVNPQRVCVNITLHVKGEKMVVDYAKVAKVVQKSFHKHCYLSVEEAMKNSHKIIKRKFPKVHKATIEISKLDIIKNCIVGVKLSKKY